MKTLHFEALKAGLSQNKDGLVLRIVIHPNDIPSEVLSAPVGQRWMVVVSPIPETEAEAEDLEGERSVVLAGMLAKNKDFWGYMVSRCRARFIDSEKIAAEKLRNLIGVASRAELKHNAEARRKLREINEDFLQWADRQT